MGVEQRWILSGLIGGILLLLFPSFLYGPSGTVRQWHFFLDSRSTINPCDSISQKGPYPVIFEEDIQACKRGEVRRGAMGDVDVFFLLLELAILGVSVFTGYYLQTVQLQRGGSSSSIRTTHPMNSVTTRANRVSNPSNP